MLELTFVGYSTKRWNLTEPNEVIRGAMTVSLRDSDVDRLREALSKATPESKSIILHYKTGEWELGQGYFKKRGRKFSLRQLDKVVMELVLETDLPNLYYRGKVRDVYQLGLLTL